MKFIRLLPRFSYWSQYNVLYLKKYQGNEYSCFLAKKKIVKMTKYLTKTCDGIISTNATVSATSLGNKTGIALSTSGENVE